MGAASMQGSETRDCTWYELARFRVPVGVHCIRKACLWKALVDKTENPERYNDALSRAELLDHDAHTVVRRTWPESGDPYIEWIRHEVRTTRVEYKRRGHGFRRAQALLQTPEGPCLVYQVDDVDVASEEGGVDASHADRVLRRLIEKARTIAHLNA